MENSYNFRLKVFHILRHQPSRSRVSKNWIILFVLLLLKAIVKDGSLYIGPKQCRVSPYISNKNFTNDCWPLFTEYESVKESDEEINTGCEETTSDAD